MSLFTFKQKWRAPDKSMMKYSKMTEPKDFHCSVFKAIPVFTESQNFVASNNYRTRLQCLSHKMLNNSNLNCNIQEVLTIHFSWGGQKIRELGLFNLVVLILYTPFLNFSILLKIHSRKLTENLLLSPA